MPAITMGKRGVTMPPFLHSSAIASTCRVCVIRVRVRVRVRVRL